MSRSGRVDTRRGDWHCPGQRLLRSSLSLNRAAPLHVDAAARLGGCGHWRLLSSAGTSLDADSQTLLGSAEAPFVTWRLS